MVKLRNHRTVEVKMSRIELCDVLLALTMLDDKYEQKTRFSALHDKLREQLDAFDKKLDSEKY